jgi:endonuclease/exonuclease/phosphatase family metal-dependent hydrolase
LKLRIATFNLENLDFEKPGKKPTLQERIAVMRPQLERVDADILCLQEVNGQEETGQPRRLLALDALLKDTQYASFNRASTMDEGPPQVYDERNLVILSRFEILEHHQYKHRFALAVLQNSNSSNE